MDSAWPALDLCFAVVRQQFGNSLVTPHLAEWVYGGQTLDPQERLREKLFQLDADFAQVKVEISQLLIDLREAMLVREGPLSQPTPDAPTPPSVPDDILESR